MESMKRIEIFKAVERHLTEQLVAKAFEIGHRSQRKDGVWEKTNNGWVRVKDPNATGAISRNRQPDKEILQMREDAKKPVKPEDRISNQSGSMLGRYNSLIMNKIKPGDNEGEFDVDSMMEIADKILEKEGKEDLADDEEAYVDFVDSIGDYAREMMGKTRNGGGKTFPAQ